MTTRIPFRVRNESNRSLLLSITDRPVEIATTSLGAAAGQLPPMSTLETFFGDDDVLVVSADGISIEKKEKEKEETNG